MLNDFYWVTRQTPAETAKLAVEFMTTRIPRMFGFDPVKDILLLAPMRAGVCGLEALNKELEDELNPSPKKIVIPKTGIAVGSRIMQTKNDYTVGREIMNGEIGIVLQHREGEAGGEVLLSLDDGDREVWVPVQDMDTFVLAWAISIHKSQGSQAKAVVVVCSTAHAIMLNRKLTYTGVTRAQQLCVMVGETKALHMAVSARKNDKRNSTLKQRVLDPNMSGQLF
jgi:exodeoxyribonuclease V alpha subunit